MQGTFFIEKQKRLFCLDRRKTDGRSGAFCRTGQSAYDPRGKPLKLAKKKSGSARLAPTGISQSTEAALFAAQGEWLMTRGVGRESWI